MRHIYFEEAMREMLESGVTEPICERIWAPYERAILRANPSVGRGVESRTGTRGPRSPGLGARPRSGATLKWTETPSRRCYAAPNGLSSCRRLRGDEKHFSYSISALRTPRRRGYISKSDSAGVPSVPSYIGITPDVKDRVSKTAHHKQLASPQGGAGEKGEAAPSHICHLG